MYDADHSMGNDREFFDDEGCETCEIEGRPYDPDKHDSVNCWAEPIKED